MTWVILATSFITVGLIEVVSIIKAYFRRRDSRRRFKAWADQFYIEAPTNEEKPPDV